MLFSFLMIPDNFLGLPKEFSGYEKSKVAILPVPYEGTVSYGKGASKGPKAIIEASKYMEVFDEELLVSPCEVGIHTLSEVKVKQKPEEVAKQVESQIKQIMAEGKFPIVLGGEHSISLGVVKAVKEQYDDLCVLHLDAHADLRDSYNGSRFSHACVARRICEICPIVQVGIRSLDEDEYKFIEEKNIPVFWDKRINSDKDWIDYAIEKLGKDVYITLDVDVLNPGEMPAVGTPEPGGLSYNMLIKFLGRVFRAKNVIGCDIVELAPIKDLNYPDFLAARLAYKMIAYKYFIKKLK